MQIALFSLGLFFLSPILASPSSANLVGPVQPVVTDIASNLDSDYLRQPHTLKPSTTTITQPQLSEQTSLDGVTIQEPRKNRISIQQTPSSQRSEITVSLDSAQLSQPHTLTIRTAAQGQLSGQITLDGVTIRELRNNSASVDLAPYLSVGGSIIVEISGHYQPTTASVQVEFSGPNTAIAQQTRSQGLLAHTLVFEIHDSNGDGQLN